MRKDKQRQEFTQVGDSLLYFVGNMIASSNIRVCGTMDGDIIAESNHVMIADDCTVNGNIKAMIVTVHGNVYGDITSDKVHITETGHVAGKITTKCISVDDGGMLDGICQMNQTTEQEDKNEGN